MQDLLIVGHMPNRPSQSAPTPFWGSASLRRLAKMMELETPNDVYIYASVVNLIPQYEEVWPMVQANRRAVELLGRKYPLVVGLGAPVRRALSEAAGLDRIGTDDWFEWHQNPYGQLAFCPHPSGANRVWNDPYMLDQGRFFWEDTLNMAVGRSWHPSVG